VGWVVLVGRELELVWGGMVEMVEVAELAEEEPPMCNPSPWV